MSDAAVPLLAVDGLRKLYPVGKVAPPWRRHAARSLLHAVDGVSFAIGRGETVGLVGESGCGKSTLVRLLARLIDPSAGAIRFDGAEIGAVPARRFGHSPQRAQIQMVFQDATDSLNPRFTASRAIADPLLRLSRLSGPALRARVAEVARLTGLPPELLSRFPHQLSGGQKARVGIARAIAVEPRLLDPRRADFGARRIGAGRDPAIARGAEAHPRPVLSVRQPRSQRRAPAVRPGAGHVSRPYHRERAGPADLCRAGASLHAGPAVGDPQAGRPRHPDRPGRRAAQPDRPRPRDLLALWALPARNRFMPHAPRRNCAKSPPATPPRVIIRSRQVPHRPAPRRRSRRSPSEEATWRIPISTPTPMSTQPRR